MAKVNYKEKIYKMIEESEKQSNNRFSEELAALEAKMYRSRTNYNKLRQAIPKITQAFKDEKLEIVVFRHSINEDKADLCYITIHATPQGRRHQFIADQGFTASGVGRNQKQLNRKAETLGEALKEATGYHAHVNPFSFEKSKNSKINDMILIEIKVS